MCLRAGPTRYCESCSRIAECKSAYIYESVRGRNGDRRVKKFACVEGAKEIVHAHYVIHYAIHSYEKLFSPISSPTY